MSDEQIRVSQEEFEKRVKLNLLREMMIEAKECFSDKTQQEYFEIVNFIDSFTHEL